MKKSQLKRLIKEEIQNVINEDTKYLQRIEATLDRAAAQVNKLEGGTPLYSAIGELESAVRSILYHIAQGAQ